MSAPYEPARLGLLHDVERAADVELPVDHHERLEPGAESRAGAPHALRDRADLAVAAAQHRDDAVGFTQLVGAQHDGFVAIGGHVSIIGAGPVKLADVSDYVFRGLEFESLERLHVEVGTQIRVTSVIDSERGRYSYELVCEPDWTFRVVRIEVGQRRARADDRVRRQGRVDRRRRVAQRSRRVHRHRHGRDPVHEHAADPAPRDEGRRRGRPARSPGSTSRASRSRPTRSATRGSAPTSYRFDSLDSDFTADLTVDDDGVVVEYPELFERL